MERRTQGGSVLPLVIGGSREEPGFGVFNWLAASLVGLAWLGLAWLGLVWLGLVWFGLVWFGLVWFGLVGRPHPSIPALGAQCV